MHCGLLVVYNKHMPQITVKTPDWYKPSAALRQKVVSKPKPKYDGLYGACRMAGKCLEDCGLCAFIQPISEPSYKNTQQVYSYKIKRRNHVLFPPDTPGMEVGYKEPLRPVEDGYGYFGTITIDQDTKSCVQCHICGFYFKELGQHIKEHAIGPREYKQRFGLSLKTPLMSEATLAEWKEKRPYNYKAEHKAQLSSIRQKGFEALMASKVLGTASYSLEWYNKFGICPDQLIRAYLLDVTKHKTVRLQRSFVACRGGGR